MTDKLDYKIIFNESLDTLKVEISSVYQGIKLHIITDQNIYNLHHKQLESNLSEYDITYYLTTGKDLSNYQKIINELLTNEFSKTDLLVAFGGGSVGDLTGFIASTLFRGVNYIQIPTTLLAQIDSSVGAKTAIDTSFGKNLIGSFYNPKLVYISNVLLETLSIEEYNNGFAEAIKMALLFDEGLFNEIKKIEKLDQNHIKKIVDYKSKVVLEDPFDTGVRRILNFGHTFGHAIEKTNNYETFKHGQAISHGMILALELGNRLNITPVSLTKEVREVLSNKGLLDKPIKSYQSYFNDLKFDKKHNELGLNFIILKDIAVWDIIIYKGEWNGKCNYK